MRRPLLVLALVLTTLALVAAGCCEGEVTATPETVEGTIPEETTGGGGNADLPALELTGDAAAGEAVFASGGCGACHTLSAAGSSGTVGPNLDEAAARRTSSRSSESRSARAACRRSASSSSHSRSRTSRRSSPAASRRPPLSLVDGFPQPVQAFACDLDGTLIDRDGGAAGIGRSPRSRGRRPPAFRSSSRRAGCSARSSRTSSGRGSASRSSATRAPPSSTRGRATFLLHEPLELDVAREAIASLQTHGLSPNVYVDDQALRRRGDRVLARLLRLPAASRSPRSATSSPGSSGSRRSSSRSPTPSGSPRSASTSSGASASASSSRRRSRTCSSSGIPARRRARGSRSSPSCSGIDLAHVVAFGDGENDVELLAVAGLGIADRGRAPTSSGDRGPDMPGTAGRGRRERDRGRPRLHGDDRPQGSAREPGRHAGRRSRARAPPRRSTACSRPTSAGARSSRGSTSCAARTKLKGKPTPEQLEELQAVKAELKERRGGARRGRGRARRRSRCVSRTCPHDDVPDGSTEEDVREVRRVGEPPSSTEPREHVEVGRFDMERAARMSGARFGYWVGDTARLALALYRFALDRARRARASSPCSRRCSCASRRWSAPAPSPPTRRTSTSYRRTACTSRARPRSRWRACTRARSSRRTSCPLRYVGLLAVLPA